ncbi:MAG: TonB-dependent receptor [Pseudomonadota bacterium]
MFSSRSAGAAAAAGFVLGLPLLSSPALAQADDAQTVVVTATRQATRADAQLSDVTVIERQQIEQAAGRTLAELLSQQPGLQYTANGGLGKNSNVFIRGAEARHTLLLVDGMRYGSATSGQPSFDNIPLEAIERIEIVRGPLSSLYGADAAGGVIQVFTRQGRAGLHPNARLTAGSQRYGAAAAGLSFGQGDWTGHVQAQHQHNRGFSATNDKAAFGNHHPDDDGFRQSAISAAFGLRIAGDWRLNARLLRSEGRTELDDGPTADAAADLSSETLGLDVGGSVLPGWHSTLRVARSTDGYDTVQATWPSDLGLFETRQTQFAWDHSVATPLGSLLLLAERLEQQVRKPQTPYEVTGRTIDAVAVGLNGHAGAHTWQASARHDRNSQFGHENTGSLAYGFDFTPQWRAGAALGTSFVAPSFNQLYWPGFGNPALKPERGRNRELSLRWLPSDQHRLQLTAYSNRVRDFIDDGGDAASNRDEARLDGATLAYEGRIAGWAVGAVYDHLRARDETGTPLVRRARHSLKLAADRRFGDWGAGATLSAFSTRRDVTFDSNFDEVPVSLPRHALLDLRAEWAFAPGWSVQARLNNVSDRQYESAYGYNQPGRELYVTLRWAPR